MKIATTWLALLALTLFFGSAAAVPPGQTVEFKGGGAGKVVFDGKFHADKKLNCPDCHTKVFQMKKGTAKITMKEMNAGQYCGTCHNGKKAFKSSDAANCARCHKK